MNVSYQATSDLDLRCEVLIIGSGAGGSAAAEVLIREGHDVLMIEEGPAVGSAEIPLTSGAGVQKMWRGNGMTAALGPVPVAYAEGRCLGGGTEINSAILQRTSDDLLDEWADTYEIDDFSGEKLKPYYDRVMGKLNASLPSDASGKPTDLLKQAGEKMGWKVSMLERGQKACVGTNMCASGCPTGGKQSMSRVVLPDLLAKGLRLIAGCRVTKLSGEGCRLYTAHAIASDRLGSKHRIRIHFDQLFLAAGAIHTPSLLRRSGITRNIGNNLRLHPTLKLLVDFNQDIQARTYRLPVAAITEFMPRIRLGGSVFVPGFYGMSLAEDWSHRKDLMGRMDQMGLYYAMVRATGRGYVRPISGVAEPFVAYFMTKEDCRDIAIGLKHLATAMLAIGAKRVYPSLENHSGWSSPDQIDAEAIMMKQRKRAQLMTIHLFSSCPMGEDALRCAVDSFGNLHGFDNVIIADASVIPEAPGVNPQATVMALSYRATETWASQNKRTSI